MMTSTGYGKKRITLKDVAKATGLAVPTVSRILNDKDNYCSQETRDAVLRMAREMNYQPNVGYHIMTGMKTNIVAIVFSQKRLGKEEHLLKLSMALTCALEQRGFAVYSALLPLEDEKSLEKIRELEGKGCRHFIFIGTPVGYEGIVQYIKGADHAYIGVNSYAFEKQIWLTGEQAIKEYVGYFRGRGIDPFRIVMPKMFYESWLLPEITPDELPFYQERLCLVELSEKPDEDWFDKRFKIGYQVAEQEYSKLPGLRGLIFLSDYYALGAARFFLERGMTVGSDVFLCGMFNTSAARFSPVPIISSDFRLDETAEQILDRLLEPPPVFLKIKPDIITERDM
jgi:DNA-binding LacI/PurR family transcriptional regulator